ncbi:hypothetical protein [Dyadobacter sp. MSC1_007]|jgi:hypothetical protein|uniref:hypothetical protein n=1 Tax=Dyadobacter sp. MSC1_007 TaxID=2909264 RepID=UPI00202E050D|nr:hypothetical protein [Dyadobacter sp. MSC1_007]
MRNLASIYKWEQFFAKFIVFNRTVKRVDTPGRSRFYYPADSDGKGVIWAEYSGINDGFEGYLIFQDDKVVLVVGEGHFESKDIDSTIFMHRRSNWTEKDTANTYRVAFPQEYEKNRNKGRYSQVKIRRTD